MIPMRLDILGPGCGNCQKLAANVEAAARELGLEYKLEKLTDIAVILRYGVMRTPALAVDGEVKIQGQIPSIEEVKKILESEATAYGPGLGCSCSQG
jgi:small redox-active disulfide protein 2